MEPQGQAGHHVDHWVSADPTGAPAILQVDSHPEATLKLRPPNSLDYSTRYGCKPLKKISLSKVFEAINAFYNSVF